MTCKIGIITIVRVNNYGAELQAYATQKVLRDLGYEAEIIDYLFYKHPRHIATKESTPLFKTSFKEKLPSFSENFGMVIAEAMSCGVPVITTKNCPWELLNKEQIGWCIDLSVEELERTLRMAISLREEELYEMGQRSAQLIRQKFDYKETSKRLYETYTKICASQ